MWRASLETLDFLPLTTVDYSGGVIITDWYSENNDIKESIKITVRFLSNQVRSDSIKIIIHKKTCTQDLNCSVNLVSSNLIKDELRSTILRKAALFEKADKKKISIDGKISIFRSLKRSGKKILQIKIYTVKMLKSFIVWRCFLIHQVKFIWGM